MTTDFGKPPIYNSTTTSTRTDTQPPDPCALCGYVWGHALTCQRWQAENPVHEAEATAHKYELAAARDQIDALVEERDQLRKERDEARAALNSAGEWIANATIAVEPGWEGSQSHVLRLIEDALKQAKTDSAPAPDATQQAGGLSPLSAAEAWHALTGEHDSVAQGNEQD